MEAHSREGPARVVSTFIEFGRSIRPTQWVKNVFVLAPLVFGMQLSNSASVFRALIATAAFCLVSSAVYLLNDIVDRHRDAAHPTKRLRAIASGRLAVEAAWTGLGFILAIGLTTAFVLDWRVGAVISAYFGLNVAYTCYLKHFAFIDTTCIALGFLFRVLAGGLAISVQVSIWLLACTFLLASLLALGKRRHELFAVDASRNGATRDVLSRYRLVHIDWVLKVLSVVTVISYACYTLAPTTMQQFGTWHLVWSIPFVIVGLWRYFVLVHEHAESQSPTDTMVTDRVFLLNVAAWVICILFIVYR
jgi:decaprenyl-phosphate phosphoribosyltransferase